MISQLRTDLLSRDLFLNDVPVPTTQAEKVSKGKAFETALIIVSTILILLLTILIVAYVLRTKSLEKQLKAYEPSKLEPVSSNLDRFGAPNTNIFSIEGSNNINNKFTKPNEFGETSTDSEDDDNFIGINNDQTFKMDDDIKDVSEARNGLYF